MFNQPCTWHVLAGLSTERLLLSFIWPVIFFAFSLLLCLIFLWPFCMRVLYGRTQPAKIAALIGAKSQVSLNI